MIDKTLMAGFGEATTILEVVMPDDNKEKLSAIKEILDRTEGKPKQEIEQTNIEVKPLDFKIVGNND